MIEPNYQELRPFIEGFNLTDEEKDEIILAVWNIAREFVEEAYGIHSVQLSKKDNENNRVIG